MLGGGGAVALTNLVAKLVRGKGPPRSWLLGSGVAGLSLSNLVAQKLEAGDGSSFYDDDLEAVPDQLASLLRAEADEENWKKKLVCDWSSWEVRTSSHLGGTGDLPTALVRFAHSLEAFGEGLEGWTEQYDAGLKARMAGADKLPEEWHVARGHLHRLTAALEPFIEEGIEWDELARRYQRFDPLFRLWERVSYTEWSLGPSEEYENRFEKLPDFALFERAVRRVDVWSRFFAFEMQIGDQIPFGALLSLFDDGPSKSQEEEITTFVRLVNKTKGFDSDALHRLFLPFVYHCGKFEPREVAVQIGRLYDRLAGSYGLEFPDEEDAAWQKKIEEESHTIGEEAHYLEEVVAEYCGCRLYRLEDGREVLVPWKNATALCRLLSSPEAKGQLRPTHTHFTALLEVVESRPVGGEIDDTALIAQLRSLVNQNSMPMGDLRSALRMAPGCALVWAADLADRVPLDPLAVEEFLIDVNPERAHDWMRRSGIGAHKSATEHREQIALSMEGHAGVQGGDAPDMIAACIAHASTLAGDLPGVSKVEIGRLVKFYAVGAWQREQGLIRHFPQSYLKRFDEKVKEKLKSKSRPPVTPSPSPSRRPPPSPASSSHKGDFV